MRTDIGRFDELHERIPLLVSGSKHDDLRFSVGHHLDVPHQVLREPIDVLF
jgi:hypothetical protein